MCLSAPECSSDPFCCRCTHLFFLFCDISSSLVLCSSPPGKMQMLYDPIQDYTRLGMIASSFSSSSAASSLSSLPPPFRIFDNNFQLTITYPNIFLVPTTINDSTLKKAAEYRSRKRTVAVVWMDPKTRVSLSRCSQPMRGIANRSSQDDQNLVLALPPLTLGEAKNKKLIFVDARGKLAALANKAKGKGTENIAKDYPGTDLLHLNIENIHHMRKSLDELTDVCEPLNLSSWEDDWYAKVDASLWLRHIRLVLGGTHEMIRLMQVSVCSIAGVLRVYCGCIALRVYCGCTGFVPSGLLLFVCGGAWSKLI